MAASELLIRDSRVGERKMSALILQCSPVARFNMQFCLLHGLQPAGIVQLVTQITFYFSTCNPRTSSPQ